MSETNPIFWSPLSSLLNGTFTLGQMQWPSENKATLTYFPLTHKTSKSASAFFFPQGKRNQICLV